MSTPKHVIVIGGGVIGAASAYYLSKAGWRVTIIERHEFGRGCSHANCGLISPSHILPLAEPGLLLKTVGKVFNKNSPLYIKPRFDPQLWGWLMEFAGRCNERCMLNSAVAIHEMLQSARKLFNELIASEKLECEFEERGLLLVYRSREKMEAFAATNDLLREKFSAPAKRFDGDAVREYEPSLKNGLAGGWFYEMDAHLRPDRFMREMRRILEARGVKIFERCEVHGFSAENGKASAVKTSLGAFGADEFVLATGALAPRMNETLGCRIPVQPGKGYSMTMPRPKICPKVPLIFPEHKVAVTPMQTGYRLGSMMEFAGYDARIDPQRLGILRRGAENYLQEPYCEPVVESWTGWRPMTYDSVPIIDRSPALDNVLIAAGHNMLGLSMGPATGKLVSEIICGTKPHLDAKLYSLQRFQN